MPAHWYQSPIALRYQSPRIHQLKDPEALARAYDYSPIESGTKVTLLWSLEALHSHLYDVILNYEEENINPRIDLHRPTAR